MAVNPVGLRPVIVVHAGDGPGVLVNRDITNQIIIGLDTSIIGNNSTSASLLDPLVGIPVSGMEDIYAATLTAANVQVDFIPRAKQWNPSPAQAAAQINALGLMKDTTGVSIKGSTDAITPAVNAPGYGPITLTAPGLLTKDTTLAAQTASGKTIAQDVYANRVPLARNESAITNGSTAALAANATATIGPFTFDSPSYEVKVTLTSSGLAAVMNGIIQFKWSNSGGGDQLAQKTFTCISTTGGHAVTFTGPVRGSSLSITFQNYNGSGTSVTFAYRIVASSRLASNDLFRTLTSVGSGQPSNQNWPGINMDVGSLMNASPSLATGANADEGMGAYNGPVTVQFQTTSGTNDAEIQIIAFDSGEMPNSNIIFDDFTDTHGNLNRVVNLPQFECHAKIINHNAATKTLSVAVTTAEPNVN